MLRVLLKMTDKGDYDWVECGARGAGWQVPHYAESVVDGEPGAATRVRHPLEQPRTCTFERMRRRGNRLH